MNMDQSPDFSLDDRMRIDGGGTGGSEEDTSSLEKKFRTNSLLLVSFPWFTSLPMVDEKISDLLHKDKEYGYVRHFSNL